MRTKYEVSISLSRIVRQPIVPVCCLLEGNPAWDVFYSLDVQLFVRSSVLDYESDTRRRRDWSSILQTPPSQLQLISLTCRFSSQEVRQAIPNHLH